VEKRSSLPASILARVLLKEGSVSKNCCQCLCVNTNPTLTVDPKHMDADLMDEKRKEHMAYEYLCHLEEAKK
jgi:hypothetical protein